MCVCVCVCVSVCVGPDVCLRVCVCQPHLVDELGPRVPEPAAVPHELFRGGGQVPHCAQDLCPAQEDLVARGRGRG